MAENTRWPDDLNRATPLEVINELKIQVYESNGNKPRYSHLEDFPFVNKDDQIETNQIADKAITAAKIADGVIPFEYTELNKETQDGYFDNTSGIFASMPGWKSMLIQKTTDDLYFTGTVSGGATAMAVYLDENGSLISIENPGSNNVFDNYNRYRLNIPDNAKSIGITGYVASGQVFKMERRDIEWNRSYWKNKKIVWFGTSISGSGYPQIVGDYLAANVINESVGSSMARAGHSNKTAEDPRGWYGLSWMNAAYSFSQNLNDKNEIINNWDFWKTKFVDSPPESLTQEQKDLILDCSWENKLQRNLGSNRADLFVFDHGHNDWLYYIPESANDLTIIPPDPRDRNYFIGAINFLIDKILSDNPRARLCFIGHYENDRKAIISQAQQKLAEYWDFDLFPLWKKLGWTQQIVNTTGYWLNGVWHNSGGAEQQLTLTQIWLEDDLHPFSNPTKELIANNIVSWINNIR